MRFSLFSKWAALAVVLAALAISLPASAAPYQLSGNGGAGGVNQGGSAGVNAGASANNPGGATNASGGIHPQATSHNPYQLTVDSRAALVPPGQTKGHPLVTMHRALHPNFSTEAVLHSFAGPDGSSPQGAIGQLLNGALFGTAFSGGASSAGVDWSFNTRSAAFSVVHTFKGSDGMNPVNIDWVGVGVTQFGGAKNMGTVYAVNLAGHVTILHSFVGTDGAQPVGNPMVFVDGCIYGTTWKGGANSQGVVYQICGSRFRTLHSFNENVEGGEPLAGLSVAINGFSLSPYLFGTTTSAGPNGGGTIYRLTPNTGAVTTLYGFGGPVDGNGDTPSAELITDFSGNLYGTNNGGGLGAGTVFRYSLTSGVLTALYKFGADGSDSANPAAPLAFDAYGNLYGTATTGGSPGEGGIVFVLPAAGGYMQIWSFNAVTNDGSLPAGPVLVGIDGNLYGTTQSGGVNSLGTIWRMQ